jgi:chromosome segregation ATPase
MSRFTLSPLLFSVLLCLPSGSLFSADQPSPAEAKLREALKNTMLQLRTSENDKATLQAAQAEADEKIKALTAQVEAATKQMAADKAASDKAIAAMQTKLDERDKILAGVREDLDKTKEDDKKMTNLAGTEGTQITKLGEQVNQLNRRVADQQVKNEGMFKIANEILARYEKFGLGDALSSREPFTGITRVKLQSLFEEYQDKLVDHKIKPDEAKPSEPAASPTPAAKSAKSKASAPKPKS